MEKKKLLIIYEAMNVGGSTTSLLSLLREFDYGRYDLDLLLYRTGTEELENLIPREVNLLRGAALLGNGAVSKVVKGIRLALSPSFYRAMRAKRAKRNKYIVLQHMSYARVGLSRSLSERYHAAIAYSEGWSSSLLLSDKIKADKKIVFIHMDYKTSGADADIDRAAYGKADALITVSESCRRNLAEIYPEYAEKISCIENIHSPKLIRSLALTENEIDAPAHFDLLTVCRPDIYVKGLDRLLNAAAALKEMGYRFKWGILGVKGSEAFDRLFAGYELMDTVIPMSRAANPYPYFLRADWLAVTSRTEAKPMTVTEAQILGVPCIATEYSSVYEQIKNGENGIVTENSEEGLVLGLKQIFDRPELRAEFSERLKNMEFKDKREAEKLYRLIDGEC